MVNEVNLWLAQLRTRYFLRRNISVSVKQCGYGRNPSRGDSTAVPTFLSSQVTQRRMILLGDPTGSKAVFALELCCLVFVLTAMLGG